MEWPSVTVDGVRWPSASELAAQHSGALGVPPERHIEIRRRREVDGERVPFDLLTFIAERGDWPWLGRASTCTGPWKTKMVYQAFTPQVRALRKETDGPLMFANVLGMRAGGCPITGATTPIPVPRTGVAPVVVRARPAPWPTTAICC
ncbi:hypothetical protein [Streptomyces antibioticus]|uniref:hypothetical protein n=1 Tax=Streptomyces antibioticus TaxID=1890 RepID=UPI0036D7D034